MPPAARTLYTFPTSVFSRRTRLALAHKGLEVALVDARADVAALEEARELSSFATAPVLVDGERVVADSTAIAHYLDLAYPGLPRLWPEGPAAAEAVAITSWIDIAMNTLADVGTRTWTLRGDAGWPGFVAKAIGRAQTAIDAVAARATRAILAGESWGAAEIWTLSATLWVSGMPARASTAPLVAQILTLGFRLPPALVEWAKQHEGRVDVKAICT